jgi:hypothetical protein
LLLLPQTVPGGLLNHLLQELQGNHIHFTINPLPPPLNGTLQDNQSYLDYDFPVMTPVYAQEQKVKWGYGVVEVTL